MEYSVPPWIGWLSIAIWLCIYLPISLFGMVLFYKYRFISAIAKRHVTMTLIVLTFCLSHICIDRVLWTMYHICKTYPNSTILNIASILTYPIILYGLMYSLLHRFWMIRFDIQFVRASMNNKWRSIVNEEYIEENWYLMNKLKWGNSKFIALYMILPLYSLSVLLSIIIRLQIYTYSDYIHLWIVDMTMVIIPYLSIIYLWFNTPSFNDTFWIHDSTKLIFMVLFIVFINNTVFGIINIVFMEFNILLSLIESHIICVVNLLIIVIMTFGVFYKNKSSFTPQQQLQAFLSTQNKSNTSQVQNNTGPPHLVLTPTDSIVRSHSLHKQPRKLHKRISLTELIGDSMMFHTFMTHLGNEFSMECLLAIVEFTEFTEYCISNFNDYLSSKHNYRQKLVKLPHDVPKSLIVYGSKTDRKKNLNEKRLHHRIITPMIANLFSKSNSNTKKAHTQTDNSESKESKNKPSPPSNTNNNNTNTNTNTNNATLHAHPLQSTPESRPIDINNTNIEILTIPPIDIGNNNSNSIQSIPMQINRNSSGSSQSKHRKASNHRKTKGLYGDLRPFQIKAKLLYEKYIEVGSQYEINISWELRNSFNTMINNDELWSHVFSHSNKNRNKLQNEKIISEKLHSILSLLNKSIQEMIKLLSHSFARFKQTPTYEKLLKLHK